MLLTLLCFRECVALRLQSCCNNTSLRTRTKTPVPPASPRCAAALARRTNTSFQSRVTPAASVHSTVFRSRSQQNKKSSVSFFSSTLASLSRVCAGAHAIIRHYTMPHQSHRVVLVSSHQPCKYSSALITLSIIQHHSAHQPIPLRAWDAPLDCTQSRSRLCWRARSLSFNITPYHQPHPSCRTHFTGPSYAISVW